jgi:hypothetical protein
VIRDPLAWLPTRVRLWAGALLCVLPLGLVWAATPGLLTAGITIFGDCGYSVEEFCTPDTYIPGAYLPGEQSLGTQVTARVFLVLAAAILGYAASRRRTPFTRRLVRMSTAAIAIAAALAAADRAGAPLVCLLAALALVAPLVWRRGPVFVPAPTGR